MVTANRGRALLIGLVTLAAIFLAVLSTARPAQAAAGDLDPSFSGDGKVVTEIGDTSTAEDVAVQDDGKVVVAGRSEEGSSGDEDLDFTVARYNPDGSLDTTFSGDGMLTTDFANGDDEAQALIVHDGKILAAGYAINGTSGFRFALARYNASDGSLDGTFDGDGKVTTPFGSGDGFNEINDLALQPDGKIVAAGYLGDFDGNSDFVSDFALARYNPDGSLDSTFSGDGKLTNDFGEFDEAEAVVVQTDGKLVVAGNGGNNGDATLVRYAGDGSLDTTFGGGDGVVNSAFYFARDLALQPDGRIVGVGGAGPQGTSAEGTFAVARYNSNGSLDTSFSGDGRQFTGFGSFTLSGANAAAFQPDGKLILVGTSDAIGGDIHFALARYVIGSGITPPPTADATKPTISGMAPRHRSTTRDTTPTIKATVRDNATNLQKPNIQLYVAGKRVATFRYNAATDRLTYTSKKLPKGKKVVRIVARDAAGNVAARSWFFKIR